MIWYVAPPCLRLIQAGLDGSFELISWLKSFSIVVVVVVFVGVVFFQLLSFDVVDLLMLFKPAEDGK